jgi:cell division protein FtsL
MTIRLRPTYGLMLVGCILALAAADVWLSHARYEVSQLTQRDMQLRQDLQTRLSQMNLELASITRPDRLRNAAKSLDMAPPSPMQVIRP